MVIAQTTAEDITGTHSKWELADIFREFGDYYRRTHKMALSHIKVMNAVKTCRGDDAGDEDPRPLAHRSAAAARKAAMRSSARRRLAAEFA